MNTANYKEIKVDGYNVKSEHFINIYNIPSILSQRTPVCTDWLYKSSDFFGDDFRDNPTASEIKQRGFKTVTELKNSIIYGVMDTKRINDLYNFSTDYIVPNKTVVTIKSVCGYKVNPQNYMRRSVKQMYRHKKEYVPDKIVTLVIDMGVSWNVKPDVLDKVGGYIVRMVKTLEDNHIKTSVIPSIATKSNSNIFTFTVDFKREGEAIDYPRLLFVTSTAFLRGLGFGWISRSLPYINGFGYPVGHSVPIDTMRKIYARHLQDPKVITLNAQDIINKINYDSEENILDYMINEVKTQMDNVIKDILGE